MPGRGLARKRGRTRCPRKGPSLTWSSARPRAGLAQCLSSIHVVGESGESDGGDHIHAQLVRIAGLPDFIERFVGGVPTRLDHLPSEPQGGCPILIIVLEPLRLSYFVLAQTYLLRDRGVYRELVSAAVVIRGRDVDSLAGLCVEGATLKRAI